MSSKNLSTPMDRRKFLRIVGLGVGTLAVTGAGGLTWRAADGGVFATGTGPAYAAWDESGPSVHSLCGPGACSRAGRECAQCAAVALQRCHGSDRTVRGYFTRPRRDGSTRPRDAHLLGVCPGEPGHRRSGERHGTDREPAARPG